MKIDANVTVTRADLTDSVYREIGLSKTDSSALVDSLFKIIESSLISDGDVKLAGFGSFVTRLKAERIGRNPRTGEEVVIAPRRVVTFKPSPKFIERVSAAQRRHSDHDEEPASKSTQPGSRNEGN